MYSQNSEEAVILDYFKDFKGRLLSIGENDGITFSNALALIEKGWSAVLVEPSSTCVTKLKKLHEGNKSVYIEAVAIGNQTAMMEFHESGTHLNKGDHSLVSTLVIEEKNRWTGTDTTWDKSLVPVYTFKDFRTEHPNDFHFITIDAEGLDFDILSQINLNEVGCKLLCVEWNGKDFEKFNNYVTTFGHHLIHQNAENLIYAI